MGKASDAFHDALREVEPQIGEQSFDSGAAQAGALLKTFGDVIDWSKYETDWITPTLIRQTYYVRSTNVPFFLTVLFYDTGKGWHIIDIQMNSYNNGKVAGYYDTVHQAQ